MYVCVYIYIYIYIYIHTHTRTHARSRGTAPGHSSRLARARTRRAGDCRGVSTEATCRGVSTEATCRGVSTEATFGRGGLNFCPLGGFTGAHGHLTSPWRGVA